MTMINKRMSKYTWLKWSLGKQSYVYYDACNTLTYIVASYVAILIYSIIKYITLLNANLHAYNTYVHTHIIYTSIQVWELIM